MRTVWRGVSGTYNQIQKVTGENYMMRTSIINTLHQILIKYGDHIKEEEVGGTFRTCDR
jgi:hypothetical protein